MDPEPKLPATAQAATPYFKYHKTHNIQPGDLILEEELWLWNFLSTDNARRACNYCFTPAFTDGGYKDSRCVSLQTCSGCKSAFYCSKACQKNDWKCRHKHECAMLKHCALQPGKYPQAMAGKDSPGLKNNIHINMLTAMAAKALVAEREQQPANKHGILTAYNQMPSILNLNRDDFIRSGPFVSELLGKTGETDKRVDDDAVSLLIQRIPPALVGLMFMPSICSPQVEKIIGVGICLEMARFGPNSCLPNAVVLPGDDRKVRVIATAHIPTLSDVRLQRDYSCFYAIMTKAERQRNVRKYFGYKCPCTRCQLGDTKDPLRVMLLRCPTSLASATTPSSACKGWCALTAYNEVEVSPLLMLPGNERNPLMTGAAAERAVKTMIQSQIEQKLEPCTVCGATYGDSKALAENIFPLTEFGTELTDIVAVRAKSDQPDKVYECRKRYLHPTSADYKQFNVQQFCGLMQLMVPSPGQSDAEFIKNTVPIAFAENAKYGPDFYAYLQDRLTEIEQILAADKKPVEVELPALHILGMWARHLNLYTLFCRDQEDRCRYEPALYRRLQQVAARLEEKAKVLLNRIVTPKQSARLFYRGD